MSESIIIRKSFRHCVKGALNATEFTLSETPILVDEETARIAISEGWAVAAPLDAKAEKKGAGRRSRGSGRAKKPS